MVKKKKNKLSGATLDLSTEVNLVTESCTVVGGFGGPFVYGNCEIIVEESGPAIIDIHVDWTATTPSTTKAFSNGFTYGDGGINGRETFKGIFRDASVTDFEFDIRLKLEY